MNNFLNLLENRILFFVLLAIALNFSVMACRSGEKKNSKEPSRPQITDPLHSKWPFYLGAAAPGNAFRPNDDQYELLRHYNVLVAENDMKPESVMPAEWQNRHQSPAYNARQEYRWANADRLVNYAKDNDIKIRGHVLFWHEQIPSAFFTTGNAAAPLVSKEVLYQRIDLHAKTVFEKYKGEVLWWDVVNECVSDDGGPRVTGNANIAGSTGTSGFTAVMTASGLTGDDRYEWIVQAFKSARKHADANGGKDVKLYLTEFGVEENSRRLNGVLRLVDYLIKNGAPIDGVGIQGHARIGTGDGKYWVNGLGNAIDKISEKVNPLTGKNLTVQVCELDVSLFDWSDTTLILSPDALNKRLARQADMYSNMFEMFAKKHSEGKLDMVLLWGLADERSWLNNFPRRGREDHPLLFDYDYQPKEVFYKLYTGPNP